ncbi:MAG: A/G-specific adenine glycosylase [Methanoregula sp.]|nr:A/G-specific adenine glycosylase [Methanoregula sp.]
MKPVQLLPENRSPPAACGNLTDDECRSFQQEVLSFYQVHGRHDMCWRHTTDPYQIVVSELMLQQTQVERVSIKFPRFIARFPDFATLAAAPLHEILTIWQGMGYNRRALYLKRCAEIVTHDHHGVLPADVEALVTLPGIGRATASSIAAFAFNMPVVFIETNIRRVYIHHFFPERETITDNEILPLVAQTLYRKNPRVWYWALMDWGAALKKTITNPNRRSAHYTRQAPFAGSDREIRGRIVRQLVTGAGMNEDELLVYLKEDAGRVGEILATLEREGLVVREGTHLYLP